jgi:toxin CcdB
MAQFDIYRNPKRGSYPLLLDVQADIMAQLTTRIVVPLAERNTYQRAPMTATSPIVTVDAREYVAVIPLLAAIAKSALGPKVGSLADRRADLIHAIDLLIAGS